MSEIKTRIVVDEDWKARVQREKEEAQLKATEEGASAPEPEPATPAPQTPPESSIPQESPTPTEAPEPAEAPSQADAAAEDLEEANPLFEGLVNMMATQAMYCLGLLGPQGQGPVTVNLEQAKESIDVLAMLRDKTQGNRAPKETALLQEALAELQRLFAARVQQAQAQAMQQAGIDPNNLQGMPPQ